MAIVINYWDGVSENPIPDKVFREGPFVVVKLPRTNGARIEQRLTSYFTTVLPDEEIYNLGLPLRGSIEQMKMICDRLNEMFKGGQL